MYNIDFEGISWVTGVYSSWVESFSISKIDNLNYEVNFNWATSISPAFTTYLRLNLKAVNLGEVTIY